ncbi:uncharacterized protein DUF4174 [Jejuia pallidilutea]|jgi:hypothetical protein|uniref:Uncharacterized protein DUF4174 n=1 Tax=Jejuia pallidilutea TaxID=504487 RepID=A0A362XDS8_9FLAO|nr:DUF4174 domain-containing protein [Jejuia pallidilutea]PQV51400.1 uncharacterized protein DUF4174 [Jejuia pallidilutea]
MKYLILIILFSNAMWSQDLESHQWKDRILVVNADEKNRERAESQYLLLNKEQQKLIDRKIVLYKCIADTCMFYDWKNTPKMFKTDTTKQGFSIVLIGLDGGEKYKSNTVEKPDVFLNLIDTMPMRRQELRNRK